MRTAHTRVLLRWKQLQRSHKVLYSAVAIVVVFFLCIAAYNHGIYWNHPIRTSETCLGAENFCPLEFEDVRFHVVDNPSFDWKTIHIAGQTLFEILRNHPMHTADPQEACLFWPVVDCWDMKGPDVPRRSLDVITSLPTWNNGKNHIVYEGFDDPTRSTARSGQLDCAIRIKSSADRQTMIPGLEFSGDLSFQGSHLNLKVIRSNAGTLSCQMPEVESRSHFEPMLGRRHYLLTFKGSRYPHYSYTSIRDHLNRIHNPGKGVIVLTHCPPAAESCENCWPSSCDQDALRWNDYRYEDLVVNSTFGLAPRGVGLHSGRFLELLCTGTIPVVLSDSFVMPGHTTTINNNKKKKTEKHYPYLDWKDAVIRISEDDFVADPGVVVQQLQQVSDAAIREMQLAGLLKCKRLTCNNFEGYVTEMLRTIHHALVE